MLGHSVALAKDGGGRRIRMSCPKALPPRPRGLGLVAIRGGGSHHLSAFHSYFQRNTQTMAAGGGFEPPVPCDTAVFETTPFVRSGIPPIMFNTN